METFLTILLAITASIATIIWLFVFLFKPNDNDYSVNQKLKEKQMAALIKTLSKKN